MKICRQIFSWSSLHLLEKSSASVLSKCTWYVNKFNRSQTDPRLITRSPFVQVLFHKVMLTLIETQGSKTQQFSCLLLLLVTWCGLSAYYLLPWLLSPWFPCKCWVAFTEKFHPSGSDLDMERQSMTELILVLGLHVIIVLCLSIIYTLLYHKKEWRTAFACDLNVL